MLIVCKVEVWAVNDIYTFTQSPGSITLHFFPHYKNIMHYYTNDDPCVLKVRDFSDSDICNLEKPEQRVLVSGL